MKKSKSFRTLKAVALMAALLMLFCVTVGCSDTGGNTSEPAGSDNSASAGSSDVTGSEPESASESDSGVSAPSDGTAAQNGGSSGGRTTQKTAQENAQKTTQKTTLKTTAKTTAGSSVVTKGKTFTIVSSLLPKRDSKSKVLFEQIFYKRVAEVEKEYGVTIKVVNTLSGDAAHVAPLIQAGKMVANVVETQVRWLPALVSAGYIKPWDQVPGIDLNNPNFSAGYTKVATIGSKHYGLQYMKPPEVRYCVVMNKNLLTKAGIDPNGIYTMINNKTWNFDKLLEYAKKTTNTGKGIYGIGGNPEYLMEMLMNANEARIVTIGSNGKATPTYTSNNVVEALDFMNKLINVEKVYKTTATMAKKTGFYTPDYISEFVQGKCTFLFEDSWVINHSIRPKVKNFDYGMITVPLGPSGKTYTSSSGHARVFYITSTNKELDFTVKIFNALAESPSGYTGDQWWKDEVALDYFQSGDANSPKTYEYLLNNMSFDFGLGMENVFDGFKDAAFGSIFWNSGKTPSAAIAGIKGNYDKAINDFFNK